MTQSQINSIDAALQESGNRVIPMKEYERCQKIRDACSVGGYTGDSVLMHVPEESVEDIQTFLKLKIKLSIKKNPNVLEIERDGFDKVEITSDSQKLYNGFTRQQILCGEYIPHCYESCWSFIRGGLDLGKERIIGIQIMNSASLTSNIAKGVRYFPTQSLAEEYKSILEGAWLPKKGDAVWWLELPPEQGWKQGERVDYNFTEEGRVSDVYFPSEALRSQFINRQKKEEPGIDGSKKTIIDIEAKNELQSLFDWINDRVENKKEQKLIFDWSAFSELCYVRQEIAKRMNK